jgi:hypothetical protein
MQVMSKPLSDALMELQIQDAERSGERYDPEPPDLFTEEPPSPAPPGLVIEKPDWREEERERAERNRKSAPIELESPQSLQSRPASKQTKSKRTPLLDEVKRWREQNR